MHTVSRDGVTGIKRHHHDLNGDSVRNLETASGRGRLKEDLESSTWRRRQNFKATPSAFARLNTIITSLKAIDEDLTSLSLDELIENLKVHDMIIKKDSKIVKAKGERKSLALKAKKESSDEECLTSGNKDEEYAMAVRDFKKCGDPNHLIEECPKPPKDKNQIAFVGGSWSDCDEEDDEKVKDETYLVAQESNELCSESYYFSDENSSIDDLVLDNEYDKLCKMSLKIITKNKRLKAARNSLEKELSILKEKVSTLEKNKGVNLECVKCHVLKIVNEKLKEEAIRLTKFEKSTHCLNETLSNKKPIGDKFSLGFNSCETSTSKSKEIKFVKSQKETSSGGGPQNTMGGPLIEQTAPKVIMGPPLNGRGAYNGRAPMDFYWLILNKPELLISSLSSFTFVWLRFLLTISPNVEVSFFKLLCTTDDIEDMTFNFVALPYYGLILFVMALFIHAL
ncbi:hypothetical protein Tco_1539551 [Tanacetum coccineum]